MLQGLRRCPDHQGKKHPQSRISYGHRSNLPEPEGREREGQQEEEVQEDREGQQTDDHDSAPPQRRRSKLGRQPEKSRIWASAGWRRQASAMSSAQRILRMCTLCTRPNIAK